MGKLRICLAAGLWLAGMLMSGLAWGQVSPTIGIASQYVFRGTPNGSPQGWGSIDWTSSSGPYASAWISSTDRDPELDLYGGYIVNLSAFRLDAGYIGYLFPSSPAHAQKDQVSGHGNNSALYAGIGANFKSAVTLSTYAYFNLGSDVRVPGLIGADDQFVYVEGNSDFSLPIGHDVSVGAHIGYTAPTGSGLNNVDGYMDYGVSFNLWDFFLDVSGNLAGDAVLGGPNTAVGNVELLHDKGNGSSRPFARPTFTVGWSKTFDGIFY